MKNKISTNILKSYRTIKIVIPYNKDDALKYTFQNRISIDQNDIYEKKSKISNFKFILVFIDQNSSVI